MRMRLWFAAIVMLAGTSTALAGDNPWVGKWKMDPSQSKLTGDTIRFAEGAGGEMMSTSQGHTSKFKMDGNPYKTWSGDEVRWKKIDDNTFEQHVKVNGIEVATNTWTISPDSKTMKIESKGKTPDGKSFDDTLEYTRVSGTKGLVGAWKGTKTEVSAPEVWNISEKGPDELLWEIETIKGTLDATLDGKDHAPVGPTVPKGLTIAVTRVSPKVLRVTSKMNGEVSERGTLTISPNGKKIKHVITPAKTNETFTVVWVKQ